MKKEPALFANNYWQVQQAYQQAGKPDDLIKLYDSMDFKSFQNNPYVIQNSIQNLFQNDNTREQGMVLLRKAWKEMPDARATLLGSIYNDAAWKLPEIYEYAREAVIPPANRPNLDPWAGLDGVSSWSNDGTINNVATQLVEASNRQGKLDDLADEIAAAIGRTPDWLGGKALLGVIRARRGKVDEARAGLEPLAQRGVVMPLYARLVVAQELDKVEALRDLELRFLQVAATENLEEIRQGGNGFQLDPRRRLALLYQKTGRAGEARDLVLAVARTPGDFSMYDASYAAYQRINQSIAVASTLFELGYPADSARFWSEVANDSTSLESARQMYGGGQDPYSGQIAAGLARSLGAMDAETLARTFRTILAPKPDPQGGEGRLDLVLLCHPREVDKAGISCLFAEAVRALKDHKDLEIEVRDALDRLVATYPDDLSVLAASALFATLDGKAETLSGPAERFGRILDARPLEPLGPGGRANARLRDQAAGQLQAWVVARECARHDATRSHGEKLAARALEAARRQGDSRWTLAMLREGGQAALDRGDKPAAEAAWRGMLRIVLAPSPIAKAPAPARGTPGPAPVPAPSAAAGSSVITLERFEQVAQLARLAADRDLARFSIDAVRESLAGGPPVTPMAAAAANGRPVRRNLGEVQADPVAQKVEERLFEMESAWGRIEADPVAVYEVFREAVLPRARPGEVFLYARPLAMAPLKLPRSVGSLLVRWALKAGKADELKAAIELRQSSPLAVALARVLLAQLAFARKDFEATSKLLDSIREGVAKDGLAVTGEQACLVALPALEVKESAAAAARVVESSIARIATGDGEEPIGSLLVRLARHDLASGRAADGRKLLVDYQNRMQQTTVRYGGDYGLARRRVHLARSAEEFARAGLLDDALDQLGQHADAPISTDYGDNSTIDRAFAPTARLLAALPAAARLDRLKAWTMPTPDRKSVRWSLLHLDDARPPAPFVGPPPVADRGLAGFGPMLVAAALEAGRLDALAAEIRPLADARVENARRLLTLIDLARGDGRAALPALRGRLEDLKAKDPAGQNRFNGSAGALDSDVLYARTALASADGELAALGEELGSAILDRANWYNDGWIIGQVRRDLARTRARALGAEAEASAEGPGLALWSARHVAPWSPEVPGRRALWAESAGVVGHVAGVSEDLLMFRYPLAGTFEFSVEVRGVGSLGYGGLFADPIGSSSEGGLRTLGYGQVIPRPNVFTRYDGFNRLTVRAEPGKVAYLVNGRPLHEDTQAGGTAPWLALGSPGAREISFRNPTLRGRPEIPREVALARLDSLDGWDASSYGETIAARRDRPSAASPGRQAPERIKPEDADWRAVDGEIRGRRLDAAASAFRYNPNQFNPASNLDVAGEGGVVQSRLAYLRPLGDGESIAFEFFHEPGRTMVHPAVGHLAFLIEPGGVRLHALVSASAGSPGDIGPDNVLDDAAGRRGEVTLRAGDWNGAILRLRGGNLSVEINGTVVHERALDPDDDRTFSLYHDKAATAARVRAPVLRGDWPIELTADQAARPFARDSAGSDRAARRARAAIVGEEVLVMAAGEVARDARKLPPADRYARLLAWVLPGDDHAGIRLNAEFGPTDPPGATAPGSGPALDSPAPDLVASAIAIGRLDDLARAIEDAEAITPLDRRGRLALLALAREAQTKVSEADAALGALGALAEESITARTPDWQRWPELIAGSGLALRPGGDPAAVALLDAVVDGIQKQQYYGAMELAIRHARAIARASIRPAPAAPVAPGEWVPAMLGTAETRGRGNPQASWSKVDRSWTHTPGHDADMLFLATPLRGDFEVDCELTTFGWREARMSYAGTTIGVNYNWKNFEVQHYGRSAEANGSINPPLREGDDWLPFRMEVKGGRMTTYAQGRKLDERPVGGESDPWLAIYAAGRLTASVRNIKVTGKPAIPDRINLSGSADLNGWLGDYHGESTRGEDAAWRKRGDEIVGRKFRDAPAPGSSDAFGNQQNRGAETIAGSDHETVLRYVRPLAEDGEVTYEYFHEPGKADVHPALDRLAFLLDPDGVKVHRITDGNHDRTGLGPGNLVAEPENRRGPARLPLRPKAWNTLRLALKGDRVTLALNGEEIYARTLEPSNARNLGLFHFADRTEARVRNVVYRGDWPRTLPADLAATPGR